MRGIQVTEYLKVRLRSPFPYTTNACQGPHDLRVTTLPDPTPGSDQYTIAISASAANFFDLLQIAGKYQNQPPFPWTAGYEFSGTIVSVPQNRTSHNRFKLGDRVFGAAQGAYATKICASVSQLRLVPDGWSASDAAGLFITAPTSYAALVQRAQVKPGEWVLVHAAAGGVGLAAVQIAKALGATVVATAGTTRKLEIARRFGADYVVDYTHDRWAEQVRKLTPGARGVDVVYDPVGMVSKSISCTAWNGRILVVGFAAGTIEKVAMNRVLLKSISVVGVHYGEMVRHEPETIEEVWDGLYDLIGKKMFRPTVFSDKEYLGLEAVPQALDDLGKRDTWGKVVLKITQSKDSKL